MSFRKQFERLKDEHTGASAAGVVSASNIEHLPITLQHFLKRTGAVGQPQTEVFEVEFNGEMRVRPDGPWLPIKAWQFTNIAKRVRLFYIEASMFGIPLRGLHTYINGTATMKIKLGGLITVADASGPIIDRSETVTFLNDMCLIAPETLIDPSIHWNESNNGTVDASLTVNGLAVQARLFFNDDGDLVNFTSDDRSMSSEGKTYVQVRWSTPCGRYSTHNKRRLPTYGEACWDLPSGPMTYARFNITRR